MTWTAVLVATLDDNEPASRAIRPFHQKSRSSTIPLPHLPLFPIPPPNPPLPYIILIVVLRRIPFHPFPERDIDSPFLTPLSLSLRNTMQPIRLRLSPHEHHIATSQCQFQRRLGILLGRWFAFCRVYRLVFHKEVARGAEGEGGD